MDFPMPDVKIMHCKVCGEEVKVNVAYPINEVTCKSCYLTSQSKSDKNFWSLLYVVARPQYPQATPSIGTETTVLPHAF